MRAAIVFLIAAGILYLMITGKFRQFIQILKG